MPSNLPCDDIMELIGAQVETIRHKKHLENLQEHKNKFKHVVDEWLNVLDNSFTSFDDYSARSSWSNNNLWEFVQDFSHSDYKPIPRSVFDFITDSHHEHPDILTRFKINKNYVNNPLRSETYAHDKLCCLNYEEKGIEGSIVSCNYEY